MPPSRQWRVHTSHGRRAHPIIGCRRWVPALQKTNHRHPPGRQAAGTPVIGRSRWVPALQKRQPRQCLRCSPGHNWHPPTRARLPGNARHHPSSPPPNQLPHLPHPQPVSTGSGVLLAFCEARTSLNDWAVRISSAPPDGSSYGTNPDHSTRPICSSRNRCLEGAACPSQHTFHNPRPRRLPAGRGSPALLRRDARCYHIHSRDDGVTWNPQPTSPPFSNRCANTWTGAFCNRPGHGIRLSRGPLPTA